MKRLIKQINRKGFTLVETLLATFILVVVSTMLVNGFIATMGYSYQTSVYSKSGANNYTTCMNTLAVWSNTPNCGDDGREVQGKGYCGNDASKATVLTFVNPVYVEPLYVHVESATGLTGTVPVSLPYGEHSYAPTADDLADNRKTFVYYPQYWEKSGVTDSLGNVIVMYDQDADKYYWVVSSSSYDSPVYVSTTAIGTSAAPATPPDGDTTEPG